MRDLKVICVGTTAYDRVLEVKELPQRPVKVRATSWRERCGGPAATASVAVVALGLKSSLWARIGTDLEGLEVLKALQAHGVETSGMLQFENATSAKSMILIDQTGERLIAGYQARGVDADPSQLRLSEVASAAAVLADDSWPEATEALFCEARRHGVPSVLDGDVGTADAAVLKHVSALSEYAVYSEVGWKILTGQETPGKEAMQSLAGEFGAVIGVTQGAEGSLWCVEGRLHHVPALPVRVVDTTGAGDVFHGAFAAAIARRQPILRAAAYASAAAAEKVRSGRGWDGMPTDEQVSSLMHGVLPA